MPEPDPGKGRRKPPLLPAPRRADGAPDPRPAVRAGLHHRRRPPAPGRRGREAGIGAEHPDRQAGADGAGGNPPAAAPLNRQARRGPRSRYRSEEHTSELQSLMRISYAVFCLKKKKRKKTTKTT